MRVILTGLCYSFELYLVLSAFSGTDYFGLYSIVTFIPF